MTMFKNILKLIMKEKSISTYVISEAIGISEGTVRGWLKGKTPRADYFFKLAEFLEIDPLYLWYGRDYSKNHELKYSVDKLHKFAKEYPKDLSIILRLIDLYVDEYTDKHKRKLSKKILTFKKAK